jgi:2-methylisocitrate lyase-like PEP mutase family enzyme
MTPAGPAMARASGPGLTDEQEIAEVERRCGLPLNVLARPNLPSPARLDALGVRRLSLGPSL